MPSHEPTEDLVSVLGQDAVGGAVLIGPTGSGRRVVLEAAIARLGQPQQRVVHLHGSSQAAQLPYGVLSFLLSQLDPGQLKTRHEMVHGLANLLAADGDRSIVSLANPASVDAKSAAILAQLASMHKIRLIVLCERPGQMPADLLALHRSGQLTRISVPRMGVSQTRTFLEGELGGPVSIFAAASLWHLTNSNRDVLRLLVRELVADRKLVLQGECWVLAPGALRIGSSLTAQVTRALLGLGAQHRELLSVLAIGGPVTMEQLRRVGKADAIATLRTRGLLDVGEEPRGEVRIKVPLLGHLLRDRADDAEREQLQETLARLHRNSETARVLTEITAMVELGNHEAVAAVVEEFVRAGGYSTESWTQDPRKHLEILKSELYALILLGRQGAAETTLERAAFVVAKAIGVETDIDELVEVSQQLRIEKARMALVAGRSEAVGLLLAGVRATEEQSPGISVGKFPSAPGEDNPDATVWVSESLQFMAMAVQAEAWAVSSRAGDALELVRRIRSGIEGLRISGVLDQVMTSSDCADVECTALRVQLLAGSWRDCAGPAHRLAEGQYPHPAATFFGETVLGVLSALSGNTDAALGTLLPVLQQMSMHNVPGQRNAVESAVAFCLCDQERNPEAVELLLRSEAVVDATQTVEFFDWVSEVFSSLTVANLDSQRTAAVRMLAMAKNAQSGGSAVLEMNSLAMALRFGHAESAPMLLSVAEKQQGPVAEGFANMARAVVESDLSLLAESLEQLISNGHRLYAMETGNGLLNILGHKERRRVIATMARCSASDTSEQQVPGATIPIAEREPAWTRELTKREAQIAQRVIDGMSNAAIARLSGVSVRTVEGHLYQVYSKLHVRNRQELTELDRTSQQSVEVR